MSEGISVFVVVVLSMVVVGVVVLMVVGVLRLGEVEVDCSGKVCFMVEGDIFKLGGVFVVVVVVVEGENFELVVDFVVILFMWCLNGRDISCNLLACW